jgi:hypothetical protein
VFTSIPAFPKFDFKDVLAIMAAKRLAIDTDALVKLAEDMHEAGVTYGLGAKAQLGCDYSTIKKIDCSGFVRYAIHYTTGSRIVMPDGSWNQDDWCKNQGFRVVPYASYAGRPDGVLRIGFMHTKPVGHVWFVLDRQTIESHGGVGPDRREWNTRILYQSVSKCYELS